MKEIKTKEQARKFCNKYIKLVDTIREFDNSYGGEIRPCMPKSRDCHIDTGAEELAKLLELKTFENHFSENITETCFYYNDVKFFEIN